jgi:hypothetical protein
MLNQFHNHHIQNIPPKYRNTSKEKNAITCSKAKRHTFYQYEAGKNPRRVIHNHYTHIKT